MFHPFVISFPNDQAGFLDANAKVYLYHWFKYGCLLQRKQLFFSSTFTARATKAL